MRWQRQSLLGKSHDYGTSFHQNFDGWVDILYNNIIIVCTNVHLKILPNQQNSLTLLFKAAHNIKAEPTKM